MSYKNIAFLIVEEKIISVYKPLSCKAKDRIPISKIAADILLQEGVKGAEFHQSRGASMNQGHKLQLRDILNSPMEM